MKKLFDEFKTFVMRGNVLDMAVGVIVGGAFGKITGSLVNDVLMPFISYLFGSTSMNALNIVVRAADEAAGVEAITIGFGTLLGTVIDFLLVALVIFAIVKAFNKAKEAATKKEEEPAAEPAPEEPAKPTTEELLTAILEELKNK